MSIFHVHTLVPFRFANRGNDRQLLNGGRLAKIDLLPVAARRESFVVLLLPVRVALVLRDDDSSQPFNVPRSDDSGNDDANWEAVIAGQRFPVHFVGEEDVAFAVDGLPEGDGSAVRAASCVRVQTFKLLRKQMGANVLKLVTWTWWKSESSVTPASFKTSLNLTPVQVAFPIAAGPQFRPFTSLCCNDFQVIESKVTREP